MPKQQRSNPSIVSAVFLSLIFSVLILANLIMGFNLGLYALTAVCGLALSFLFPTAGIFAVTFLTLVWSQNFTLSPFIYNQVEYKFYLVDIFLVSIYFRTALEWLKIKKPKLNKIDKTLIVFFLWVAGLFAFSMTFWQGSLQPAFSSLKNYVFYPIIFFVVWFWFRNRQIFKNWFSFFIAGAVVSLGFLVYGLITGQGLWTDITPLTTSGVRYLDFNHAFYLCLAFIMGLSYLIWQKDKLAQWFIWLLPLFLLGIVGSMMRHLWLALAVYLVWLVINLGQSRANLKILVTKYLAVGVLLTALGLFIFNLIPQSQVSQQLNEQQGNLITRAVSLFDEGDTSIAWRGTLWQVVVDKFIENPLIGQGLGQNVFIDMGDYKDFIELRNVHNSFLAILAQVGIIGFVLFFVFIIGQVVKIWQAKVKTNFDVTVRYAFTGTIIFCFVAFMFQPYLEANFFSLWWWIFLGLGRAYYEGTFSK